MIKKMKTTQHASICSKLTLKTPEEHWFSQCTVWISFLSEGEAGLIEQDISRPRIPCLILTIAVQIKIFEIPENL